MLTPTWPPPPCLHPVLPGKRCWTPQTVCSQRAEVPHCRAAGDFGWVFKFSLSCLSWRQIVFLLWYILFFMSYIHILHTYYIFYLLKLSSYFIKCLTGLFFVQKFAQNGMSLNVCYRRDLHRMRRKSKVNSISKSWRSDPLNYCWYTVNMGKKLKNF